MMYCPFRTRTKGRMTPLGKYPKKTNDEGNLVIAPINFIRINWDLTCQIGELSLPVKLHLTTEKNSDELPLFFGMRTAVNTRHHEVWLSPSELEKDCYNACQVGDLMPATLWSIQMTMLRLILVQEGIVPRDQYIDEQTALSGNLGENFVEAIKKRIDCDPQDPDYPILFDAWVIFNATYKYMGLRDIEDEVRIDDLRKIIRAEKDVVSPGFFS